MDKCNKKLKSYGKGQVTNNGNGKGLKQLVFKGNVDDKHWLFNHGKKELKSMSKDAFSILKLPTILLKGNIIKYKGCSRQECLTIMQCVFLDAQFDFSKVKSLVDVITALAGAARLAAGFYTNVTGSDFNHQFLLELLEFGISVVSAFSEKNALNVTRVALSFYNLMKRVPLYYSAQSLESVSISALSLLLPKELFEVVRRMNTLVSIKPLDELGWLNDFLGVFSDFISKVVEMSKLVLPPSIHEILKVFSSWTQKHLLVKKAKLFLSDFRRSPNCLSNPFFCTNVTECYNNWFALPCLVEWGRRSAYIKQVADQLEMLYKQVLNQNASHRKEPNCFVFEGPPGSYKSVTMGQVVDGLPKSVYVHNVKSVMDGKDFYDSYNGESLFVMDDLGQQGVSQWRTIINMVSTSQMKLDCAAAELKDTKFFTSDTILLTTNHFMHLHGITANDCITELPALWRRGNVFDFNKCKQINGRLVGTVYFRYYSIENKRFENGFPPEVEKFLPHNFLPYVKCDLDASRVRYLKWFITIIKAYEQMKHSFCETQKLSDSEREELLEDFYDAQADENFSLVDAMKEWLISLIPENLNFVSSGLGLGVVFLLLGVLSAKFLWKYVPESDSNIPLTTMEDLWQEYHPSVLALQKQILNFSIQHPDGKEGVAMGLISGHYVVLPFHCLPPRNELIAPNFVTGEDQKYWGVVITGSKHTNVLVDHLTCRVVFHSHSDDVAILELPLNLPVYTKNLGKNFGHDLLGCSILCTAETIVKLDKTLMSMPHTAVYKASNVYSNTLQEKDVCYEYQNPGICGSLIVSRNGKVKGMHVAGLVAINRGVSLLWSEQTRAKINDILTGDVRFFSSTTIRELKDSVVTSGVRLEEKGVGTSIKKSNFVPSKLYKLFDTTRSPANLVKFGDHTIKDVARKSFEPACSIGEQELLFAESVLHHLIPPFSPLTTHEVVVGTDLLAPLNKDSSNGPSCLKEKEAYIDFVKGDWTPLLCSEVQEMFEDMLSGKFDVKKWWWTEQLKDELRNDEKDGLPRSFRIARIHNQVITKMLFGGMVENIVGNRHSNKIMIGVNPYTEWDQMYETLSRLSGVWDGDIKKFDGKMLPQLQQMLARVLPSKLTGLPEHRMMAEQVLFNMFNTPVSINDDLWVTTHSMPSGSFLTAIVNSIVNRLYTAMWYFREMTKNGLRPSVFDFNATVVDYVYGDDKLDGVTRNESFLNAITMQHFFRSIGMDFTTAEKGEITRPFVDLKDVSFLKRKFIYHSKVGKVMCPLDLRTIYSGLSWIDKEKDEFVVMRDKLHSFQRELFLHEEIIPDHYKIILKKAAAKAEINFEELSEHYLVSLFRDPESCASMYKTSWAATLVN